MSASPSPLPRVKNAAPCRGGRLCLPKGPLYQEGAGRAKRGLGEKPRRSGCRGRCRAQLFATKERYRCGLPLAGTHRPFPAAADSLPCVKGGVGEAVTERFERSGFENLSVICFANATVSLRLGHGAGLTAHWAVIQHRAAASLPFRGGKPLRRDLDKRSSNHQMKGSEPQWPERSSKFSKTS